MSSHSHRIDRDPVVVGIDGSESSQDAACLGAWEASRRGCATPARLRCARDRSQVELELNGPPRCSERGPAGPDPNRATDSPRPSHSAHPIHDHYREPRLGAIVELSARGVHSCAGRPRNGRLRRTAAWVGRRAGRPPRARSGDRGPTACFRVRPTIYPALQPRVRWCGGRRRRLGGQHGCAGSRLRGGRRTQRCR